MAKKPPPTKKKKTAKKAAPPKSVASKRPLVRKLQPPKYKSFRLNKHLKHPSPKMPPAWKLFWRSLVNLVKPWKVFLGILAIYTILSLSLVKGFTVNNGLLDFKQTLQSLTTNTPLNFNSGVTLLNFLLSNSGPSSDVGGAYLTMLLIIVSLVIIWALRQTQAGAKITIRDAFYKSLYPLIPIILVLLVIGFQIIPMVVANTLYVMVFGTIAVTLVEKALWAILLFLLVLLSIYLVTSSIFALYIVTLPDVAPMQALRSARELVRYRRWTVMRKLLFLPFIMLLIGSIIMMPIIFYITVAAEWVYFGLSVCVLFIIHSYIYTLYRELLE
jgi:hypothetical protein